MKHLAIALSLTLSFASWFAEASCAPITTETTTLANIENIGLLTFLSEFESFRSENLSDTSLCTDELHIVSFSHAVDFVRMQGSTVKIDKLILAELGAFATQHSLSKEEAESADLKMQAMMGVMTYFSYTNQNWQKWYLAEAQAAVGNTAPLSLFNLSKAELMAKEKPLMALGLGIYRALTFNRLPTDKKVYKQTTHATPYQIAKALLDAGKLQMARELLILTQQNGYSLADKSRKPEMTLEILNEIEQVLQ